MNKVNGLAEELLFEFADELRKNWSKIPKKGHSFTDTVTRILQELGDKRGFQKEVKVKGEGALKFDLVKGKIAVEVLWGDGDEFWKDICKLTIDGEVDTLYIIGRYYPDTSMKGILYCWTSLKSIVGFLKKNNLRVYLVRIFLPEDWDKTTRKEDDFDLRILEV